MRERILSIEEEDDDEREETVDRCVGGVVCRAVVWQSIWWESALRERGINMTWFLSLSSTATDIDEEDIEEEAEEAEASWSSNIRARSNRDDATDENVKKNMTRSR